MDRRIITNYQCFKFKEEFWDLRSGEKSDIIKKFLDKVKASADTSYFYQVYPSRYEYDFMVWSNVEAEELDSADKYFERLAKAVNPHRNYIEVCQNFWGMTKPSQYSKSAKSAQEIDPFDHKRTPYFIVYPFTKTIPWYLESGEERMRMMRGHISLGKQYREITQLLLYSFGLQDQEFVVAYECENLAQFSDLVYDLRATEARKYTENDTPIITGVHRSSEELIDLFV